MATVIDTHKIVQELRAADFSERQAEALARIERDRAEAIAGQLATKDDLTRVRAEIDAKLDATYWKVMAGVAVLLLANIAATWGIVASYAIRAAN